MIEINLLPKRRQLRLPTIMGLDLKALNIKWLLLTLLILYLPGFIYQPIWQNHIDDVSQELAKIKKKAGKLNRELGSHAMLKKQLDEFNAQVKKLQRREKLVAEVLKEKVNPYRPLLFLVKNIPDDMWWDFVALTEDRVSIKGGSLSYKSIGDFILNANDSIYFGGSFVLKDSKTQQEQKKGKKSKPSRRRIERYTLSAKIKRYE
ncbi:MAG: PilN domain-containing protein [Bdellovibrionales bacterium]|jgi:Tfp pilus assembly protein PilN|nr:PilN domain-containing protein [Bdellovibrionales bacterium]MBT3526104.1 PilN domain-containing protein [Bdellovibrionales bacterium]MBT7670522.1 PilN domain-containing protein [Bdellovibrionales bacterium]MBT7766957.1 PilN domain-containing protein [Bdellovibrionales bacterium]